MLYSVNEMSKAQYRYKPYRVFYIYYEYSEGKGMTTSIRQTASEAVAEARKTLAPALFYSGFHITKVICVEK